MAMMGMWMRISDALHGVYDRTEWSSTAPIEGEGGGVSRGKMRASVDRGEWTQCF